MNPGKNTDGCCFYVAMGIYDEAEIYELVGIHLLFFLATILGKRVYVLYKDDRLLILHDAIGQQKDQISKSIMKLLKNVSFGIDVETNLKITNFLNVIFNVNNDTYRMYTQPNDSLLYVSKSSDHPPLYHQPSPENNQENVV